MLSEGEAAGLQTDLDALGFNLVGYGCTTCIGNSGPLDPALESVIREHEIDVAAVLSGNRNFEGRVHALTTFNYLMSPPLVVAYALAGSMQADLTRDPLGEDADGNPSWNGWTHTDITQPTESHWSVSNYNQPDPANHAAWGGDIGFAACIEEDPEDPVGGYGNEWHDILEFRQTVPNASTNSTVSITATLIYDSEPGYDYTYLSYKFNGQQFSDIQSWDGTGTETVIRSVSYLPHEYMDGTDIAIYFRFQSDQAWSDEDCLQPTAGACQVDDINVHLVNGEFTGDFSIHNDQAYLQADRHSFQFNIGAFVLAIV